MPPVECVTNPDPRALLAQAAAGFLAGRPDCLLVLRQGILRDDLRARARAAGVRGWVNAALCTFAELPRFLGRTPRVALGDVERRALLAELLRRHATRVLHRPGRDGAVLRAVDQLVGELCAEEVGADRFRAALEAEGERDGFDRDRDADLADTYAAYLAALGDAWRDGRDTLADCARALRADPAALAERLGGHRSVHVLGLQDLRGGWGGLLHELARHPALDAVRVFSAVRLAEGGAVSLVPPSPALAAISAPDTARELETVAARVRALLDDGVPPHRIAVVAREARPAVDRAADALERFGVPVTVRRRVALREVPVVRAVTALLRGAGDGWTRHALAELAEQPYLACGLDAAVVNHVGYRARTTGLAAWEAALGRLEREARAAAAAAGRGDDDGRAARRFPAPDTIAAARRGFRAFAREVAVLDTPRPLEAWLEWMARLLTDDPWAIRARTLALPGGDVRIARLDLRAWDELAQVVAAWRDALARWGDDGRPLDAAAFAARLDELLEGDVILWSDHEGAVLVVEALGAAYHEVDHLFLVGMEAGRFPRRAPASPLLDDRARQRLIAAGLPLDSRETWERRERQLLDVLLAGASQVTLSWSRKDEGGREAIRSVYVEELALGRQLPAAAIEEVPASRVLVPGRRLVADDAAAAQAAHGARIELLRRTTAPSPWNGAIADPALVAHLARRFGEDYRWSPTQLESYAKCPWAFFSQRVLRLEELAEPDDDLDPRARGTILHEALRRFFERLPRPAWLTAELLEDAGDALEASLDAAIAAQGDAWPGHPALAAARRTELLRVLQRFLVHEADFNAKHDNPRSPRRHAIRLGVVRHEVPLDDVTLERDGVRFRYRGTVDRVEECIDGRAGGRRFVGAADYKTSRSSTPARGASKGWDDGVVLQVPLYAHALHVTTGHEVARVAYRSLRDGETVHELQLWTIDRATGEPVPNPEARARLAAALDRAAAHVARVRRAEFPADPPASCGCPPFCHAREICRVAGGPRIEKGR